MQEKPEKDFLEHLPFDETSRRKIGGRSLCLKKVTLLKVDELGINHITFIFSSQNLLHKTEIGLIQLFSKVHSMLLT